jgi:hypothetical protein
LATWSKDIARLVIDKKNCFCGQAVVRAVQPHKSVINLRPVHAAVLSNAGTLILLRVGGADTALLALQKQVWAALLTIPFGKRIDMGRSLWADRDSNRKT